MGKIGRIRLGAKVKEKKEESGVTEHELAALLPPASPVAGKEIKGPAAEEKNGRPHRSRG